MRMQVVPSGDVPESQEEAESAGLLEGFTFCGLLSLIDPPRDAVRDPGTYVIHHASPIQRAFAAGPCYKYVDRDCDTALQAQVQMLA